MALQKATTYKGFSVDYHKIIRFTSIDWTNGRISFDVGTYKNSTQANSNINNYIYSNRFSLRLNGINLNTDPRNPAYVWLKNNVDFYQDAIDV